MRAAALDTCVLWPARQRDFLLSLAAQNLFRPVWSAVVLAELAYEEAAKLVARGEDRECAAARAAGLVEAMRSRFPDALITGWQPLEGTFSLPDRNDEHVLAAAVTAGADAVVTDNLRDFPATSMPPGIAALTPARFAAAVIETDPAQGAGAVVAMAARSGRHGPSLGAGEILDVLARRYAMTEASHLIRPHL